MYFLVSFPPPSPRLFITLSSTVIVCVTSSQCVSYWYVFPYCSLCMSAEEPRSLGARRVLFWPVIILYNCMRQNLKGLAVCFSYLSTVQLLL